MLRTVQKIPVNMLILQATRRIATLFGIHPIPDEKNVRFKFGHALVNVFIPVALSALEWYSVAEVLYQLKRNGIVLCLYAVLHVVPLISTIGSYISLAYQMGKIRDIFDAIQKIFVQCNCMRLARLRTIIIFNCEHFNCRRKNSGSSDLFARK